MQLNNTYTFSNLQQEIFDALIECIDELISKRKNRYSKLKFHTTDHLSIRNKSVIDRFINRNLIIDSQEEPLKFKGMSYYQPIIWTLKSTDDCKRVAHYIVDKCTSY